MKRYGFFLFLMLAVFLLLTGGGNGERENSESGKLRVVNLVNGTLGDKSFFDSAVAGMDMILEELGNEVEGKTIEMSDDETKWEPTLLDVVDQGWDVVILGTWQMTEILQDVAAEYPEVRFIFYDSEVDYTQGFENVYSILYKQNEASFIAGAIAAAVTQSSMPETNTDKLVGFLGGMDVPVVNDFLVGYIEGARHVLPDIKVAISYIGSFYDSAKGKEMALAQYNLGVDIGYNVAGQAGLGQLDAAKDVNRYAIGVDSDQAALFLESDPVKAALIATSVLKRVDMSIFRAVKMHLEGTLPYGRTEILGFQEGGVGIARNEVYMKVLPEDLRRLADEIEADIIDGKIVVSSAFGLDNEYINNLRNEVKP